MRMLVEISFTKTTRTIFPNTILLISIISCLAEDPSGHQPACRGYKSNMA